MDTERQVAFEILKGKLISASALGLPNLQKPFKLYVHEKHCIGLRLLIQMLRYSPQPVVYSSKKLDHMTKEWPPCLEAVAATCDVLQEAEKFTLDNLPQYLYCIRSSVYWNRKVVIG